MNWLQWPLLIASLLLQVMVLSALLRGAYKSYPLVFAYSLVLVLTSVVDAAVFANLGSVTRALAPLYYRDEALRQLLLFLVVVSLVDRSVRNNEFRMRVHVVLAAAAATAAVVSFYIHWNEHFNFVFSMTKVARDLSFGSVILVLVLWSILISSRTSDHLLLMVTGGLGLQFTGEAVGQSLRQVSKHNLTALWIGNILLVVSHLLRLYVWWEAFRREPRKPSADEDHQDDGTFAASSHHHATCFKATGLGLKRTA